MDSYVGTIALGWMFAQGLLHFAYVFSEPVAHWLTRREYLEIVGRATVSTRFSFQDALPELIRSIALLLVAYVLLRWLYYEPTAPETEDSHPAQPL